MSTTTEELTIEQVEGWFRDAAVIDNTGPLFSLRLAVWAVHHFEAVLIPLDRALLMPRDAKSAPVFVAERAIGMHIDGGYYVFRGVGR